ncbi:DUF86 domain-containing protein [Membranicola marinus]|uniref:DUF86 domain-containing protein n=1 Tax=Membranihabitans marinus TaxID=1227546 RepID=A0A953HWK8_9BACT|nr:HepT-like ribonuclease domain-containing protein [Membranihabitans marinus]MBY5959825.1 DUF86 domain-containing protein [Membranihabitans marinus]
MLRKEILKYILDIETVISELEDIIEMHDHEYEKFNENFVSIRAVERDLMIIGEAVGKILKIDSNIKVTGGKHIISLRNMLVHAYDSIDPTTLWRILIKDLPILKKDIQALRR